MGLYSSKNNFPSMHIPISPTAPKTSLLGNVPCYFFEIDGSEHIRRIKSSKKVQKTLPPDSK